jgi:hypothetical protein
VLDEAFGVAANKQGVRLKGYVVDAINDAIGADIATLNEEIKRFHAQQAAAQALAKPSPSETKASEADPFQQNAMVSEWDWSVLCKWLRGTTTPKWPLTMAELPGACACECCVSAESWL